MKELSIVITVLNEEDNIELLTKQIRESLRNFNHETIWVDDGSTDNTVDNIKRSGDENTKLISLTRNFGQTAAMSAGIDMAEGEYIVTLDGDLQNNPSDIPMMLEKLKREGWDVVTGFRKKRKDGLLLRKIPSKVANWLIRMLTGVAVRDFGCSLKVFKSSYAKNLGLFGELHRFIPVLLAMEGAKITDVEVSHFPRIYGRSKYGLGRTVRVMSDLFLMMCFQKYLKRPFHFFGPLGMITLLMGSTISVYLLVTKVADQTFGGIALVIMAVVLVLAGIQFLGLGLIAEFVVRIYYESRNKKIYSIREVFHGNEALEKVVKIRKIS